ncbi:hypothetical protein K1719_019759 [Acacia pycnantha]|nr:hypothetical protein K1719_019759 [Acacia pycnantha]
MLLEFIIRHPVIVMWVLRYKYILHLFHGQGIEEQASHQMADLEAASTISTASSQFGWEGNERGGLFQ